MKFGIGQSVKRKEDVRFVCGTGSYSAVQRTLLSSISRDR